jgi:hypothetical protein
MIEQRLLAKRAFKVSALRDRGKTFIESIGVKFFERGSVRSPPIATRGSQQKFTSARGLLEHRGALPPRLEHQNGAKWIFWAAEPKADADN